MKLKHINLLDILIYGGLALVATAVSIVFACFQETWDAGKIVVMIAVPLAFIGIALVILLRQYYSKPDWTTKQGVLVWSKGIPFFDDEDGKRILDRFLDSFMYRLPKIAEERWGFSLFNSTDISSILLMTNLQWTTKPISLIGIGWSVKDKAGLQQGYNLMVYWDGRELSHTALVHELMHEVRQMLVSKGEIDYKHEDSQWWGLAESLTEAIRTDVHQA